MPAWIPVADRLPNQHQRVLVVVAGNDMVTRHQDVSRFTDGKWSNLLDEPTHWMPLPEFPDEQDVDTLYREGMPS